MTEMELALLFIVIMDRRIRWGGVYDCAGNRIACLGQLLAAIEAKRWP